ncbi:MAG TPA: T9SS type A sorting domain-containing protein [Saprospiraceae bacterium]|nr:T9SS type A sorting domain-containing protein [Saprospiraceae bacterium]HMQ85226.1 T9SS type A sorting domain-containing protein [Saprospiraceae bacterium]
MKKMFIALSILLFIGRQHQAQSVDPDFQPFITSNSRVLNVAQQSNGQLLVLGTFTYVGDDVAVSLCRLNADGSLDASFSVNRQLQGMPTQLAILPNGQILIAGGSFNAYGTQSNSGIAILEADGSLYQSIDLGNIQGSISMAAPLSDGNILVAGDFKYINGQASRSLARISPEGELLQAFPYFVPVFDFEVQELLIHADDSFTAIGDDYYGLFVRHYLPNGEIDPDFQFSLDTPLGAIRDIYDADVNANGEMVLLAATADNDLLVLLDENGQLTDYSTVNLSDYSLQIQYDQEGVIVLWVNQNNAIHLQRYVPMQGFAPYFSNADPISSNPFANTTFFLEGSNFYLRSNSEILGVATRGFVQLTPEGSIDDAFEAKLSEPGRIYDVQLLPDGHLIVRGWFQYVNEVPYPYFVILNASGLPIAGPPQGLSTTLPGPALVSADGSTILWDYNRMIRLLPDFTLDTNNPFQYPISGTVAGMTYDQAGNIIVYGRLTIELDNGNTLLTSISRWLPDGTLDNSLAPVNVGENTFALEVLPDGSFIVGGSFFIQGSTIYNAPLLHIFSDGSIDTDFVAYSSPHLVEFSVADIEVQDDGKMILAGYIGQYLGETVPQDLIRLMPNGALDPTFNAGGSGFGHEPISYKRGLYEIDLLPGGDLLVAGYALNDYNGLPVREHARIHPDGTPFSNYGFEFLVENSDYISGNLPLNDSLYYLFGCFAREEAPFHTSLMKIHFDPLLSQKTAPKQKSFVTLFPNPAAQYTLLQGEAKYAQRIRFRLFDLGGRLLREWQREQGSGLFQEEIDLKDLPAGWYQVQVNLNGQWLSGKVAVMR